MDPRALVEAFYHDLWNRQDRSRIAELLHEDFSFRGSLGAVKHGHAAFWDYVVTVTGALGDYRCEIRALVCEADRAFARMLFSGVHRGPFLGFEPTGRTVAWEGAALFTIRDGRIADLWVLGDVHGLRERLRADAGSPSGAVPP